MVVVPSAAKVAPPVKYAAATAAAMRSASFVLRLPDGSVYVIGLFITYAYGLCDCARSGNCTKGSGLRKRPSAGS